MADAAASPDAGGSQRSLHRRTTSTSDRDNWHAGCDDSITLTVVVAGASGDLAKKKTYPALQFLFANNFLPKHTKIVGYARSAMTGDELRRRLRPALSGSIAETNAFLSICSYLPGSYDSPEGFQALEKELTRLEAQRPNSPTGRLFYLALPPSVYPSVCKRLKENCDGGCKSPESWIRLIVEKPFGHDLASSEALAEELGELYPELQLYRIDHYLGKEMLQNLFVLRFANSVLGPIWNRASVASVQITFKEDFGTQGRGGFFDSYGIIRDVIQNHLAQVLAFVAMEKPVSIHPDDIRDAKTQVLRCVRPVKSEDVVLGQYVGAGGEPGYTEDPTVPEGSHTPTFASVVMYIDNDRWAGVPFVLRAGKALNERKAEIRLQLHETPHFIFPGDGGAMRNEIVVRLQPDEAIYMKLIVKQPGLTVDTAMSELDLDYRRRYPGAVIPDAYPRLILEAIRGDQQHFVRRDELRASWAIFTPLLQAVDAGKVPIHEYPYGSRGPPQSDALLAKVGYRRPESYAWTTRSPHIDAAL